MFGGLVTLVGKGKSQPLEGKKNFLKHEMGLKEINSHFHTYDRCQKAGKIRNAVGVEPCWERFCVTDRNLQVEKTCSVKKYVYSVLP